MKQVRYIAGAAGFIPTVFAAYAVPATAAEAAASTQKTVSLGHSRRTMNPDAYCTGKSNTTWLHTQGNVSERVFYTHSSPLLFKDCVGTIDARMYYGKNLRKWLVDYIYNSSLTIRSWSGKVSKYGTTGTRQTYSWPIHSPYPQGLGHKPMNITAYSQYGGYTKIYFH